MSAALIAFVTLIYLAVAISEWSSGTIAMAIVYIGYAFANVGLIMSVWK